jgi:two-component system sensor histidine kinase KdpD
MRKSAWQSYVATLALVATATGLGTLGGDRLAQADLVMLYILVIGVAAARFGRRPSLMASALSVLAYDFFFVAPFHTFTVEHQRHLLTFATMFGVGLVTSSLTSKITQEKQQALARERRTAALYSLSRDLGAALDQDRVASVAAEHVAHTFAGAAAVLLPDEAGVLRPRAQAGGGGVLSFGPTETAALRWAFEQGRYAGAGTKVFPEATFLCAPLRSGVQTLGALALGGHAGGGVPLAFPSEAADLLDAFARQAALALARARFAQEAELATVRARTEQMRSSLLAAVSHDLRTPLAAITGAATTLRDDPAAVGPGDRAELLDTICQEAERLERLVRNLLDMTRLDSGAIEVKREWVPVEEIVGSSLTRLEAQLGRRPIALTIPEDLPLVSADPVLLEQVFINLFENAAKYAPGETPLEVTARPEGAGVVIEIADRGPGIPAGSETRIFEKFFRGAGATAAGAGLGLAIARGIIEAHGGSLTAENRAGGGARFRVQIPGAPGPAPLSLPIDPASPTSPVPAAGSAAGPPSAST